MPLSKSELARYSRHLVLNEVGLAGQEKLRAARVLVVGAGGLGSPAALYLAASGIGTLGLVDCDAVDLSNLQRQILYTTQDVARPKAEAARERLGALNPDIRVVSHAVELRAANVCGIVQDYDVVLDGTDRLGTRYVVNDACVILRKPLVSAAIHRFEGQAMTYLPGRGPCYRCLFPKAEEGSVPNCATAGVLGVLPGVLGTIQATEAIKIIVGKGEPLVGRLLVYDALEMRFQEFRFERRRDCAVCGDRPTIRAPQDAPADRADAAPADLQRLSPQALKNLLDADVAPGPRVCLIDVRERQEFHAGHLAGAMLIPVGELEERLGEIPREGLPVFVCRTGVRSVHAAAIASRHGIAVTAHLEGGLRAWAALIDPSIDVV